MLPVEVSFQRVDASEALRKNIVEHAQRLETFAPDLISCRATVRPAESCRHKGNRFTVHLQVTLPGAVLNSGHTPREDQTHEDPFVAARDSFRAMRRQLEDYERRRRGKVKRHTQPAGARVLRIDPGTGRGVLITPDERKIGFSRNSVVDAEFDRMAVGDSVRFAETEGEDGPWASTVHLRRPRRRGSDATDGK